MSVLKAHRTESKAEFVNVANQIYVQTIQFLSRLSSRYSRLLSSPVSALASEVIDHAEKANSIYPSDDLRKELRKTHLLEARASLMALDDAESCRMFYVRVRFSGSGFRCKAKAGEYGAKSWRAYRHRKRPADKRTEK